MNVCIRWPGAALLSSLGILLGLASLLITFAFDWVTGLTLLAVATLFFLLGRRKGTVFQWDKFFPAERIFDSKGISYAALTGVVIVPYRVIFVFKDAPQTSIPISAGTATVLNHLMRLGVRVEHKLSDAEWHRAQKTMLLWDHLDHTAILRTHAWVGFMIGIPAFAVYLTMLAVRGAQVNTAAWMENALFIALIGGVMSLSLWLLVILVFRFSHGAPGESVAQIQKAVVRTDIGSGVLAGVSLALALAWFYSEEKVSARQGIEQPQAIAEAFGRRVNRAPASTRSR